MGGIIQGKGEMISRDGTNYKGQFMNNLYHGRGILTDYNNLIYEGQFKEGLKCGIGEQQCEDGTWIKGKWLRGVRGFDGCKYKSDRKTLICVVDRYGRDVKEIEVD